MEAIINLKAEANWFWTCLNVRGRNSREDKVMEDDFVYRVSLVAADNDTRRELKGEHDIIATHSTGHNFFTIG